ncbi:1-aminocyclopropane-1-carboxylate deaminase/D-cysteine desulfhydrase [Undibacterium crateris]|uniref:1-aminocyclopropane-1-carboxylate deaminase/D-cysteine desulfhydrase n=1 Tax=Undibacterium crateris TaxID=2528175 RepID=UPI00138A3C87|nr:pyridoxal-phosphate dependent enzyme [Undibacterium crateris]NDI85011.1 pyridoxal-phosphate dependent enzyme [Undibacterium crateris]
MQSDLFPGIRLWMKRDDLLHPEVSGNKFRKLKYSLLALSGQPLVLSMGGLWSNHLHALAHALQLRGMQGRFLVRAHAGMDSAMLADCRALGMQLVCVSREDYRRLRQEPDFWRQYAQPDEGYSEAVWLPEGGSAASALHGVAELVPELEQELGFLPDHVWLAAGTGATAAGVLAGMRGRGQVTAVASFPNAAYLQQEVADLLRQAGYPQWQNFQLLTDFHHGGYARMSPELTEFCKNFYASTGIPTEPVYTGKMLYALHQLCLNGLVPPRQTVVAVHTGGMQGVRGFPGWASF